MENTTAHGPLNFAESIDDWSMYSEYDHVNWSTEVLEVLKRIY